jgi:hypothetical protein
MPLLGQPGKVPIHAQIGLVACVGRHLIRNFDRSKPWLEIAVEVKIHPGLAGKCLRAIPVAVHGAGKRLPCGQHSLLPDDGACLFDRDRSEIEFLDEPIGARKGVVHGRRERIVGRPERVHGAREV